MHVLGRGHGTREGAADGLHEPDLRRRRRVRRVVVGTALTLVAAGALSGAQWGQAATAEQVLQAVNIDLGSNGAITKVADTDIRKDLPGYKTTTTDYAPTQVASTLPVSVTTSYIRNGVPGTDISALALQPGLIEVDVTVTNTTLKPMEMTYPVNGVQHTQYALVGAPLTVTANATLPKGSYARIVQADPGTSDPHTTNGVVSSDDKGASTVSWSALLAPPALSPTTTFSLVEQAQKFQMPQFSLSVSPGLNADPSVDGLLSETFGTSNSLLATQNQAISLVDQINGTLNSVSSNLADIQSALGDTATGLGQSATSALEDVGSQIGASSQELSGELDALQSTVSGSVSKAGSTADTTLNSTVNSLISYIGGPESDPLFGRVVAAGHADVTAPAATGCTITSPGEGTSKTLYGQLQDVQHLITAISTGSQACISSARSELLATIGDNTTMTGAGACPSPDLQGKAVVDAPGETIVCDIVGSAANLDAATGTTGADIGTLAGVVTSSQQAFSNLGTAVSSLDSDLTTLYGSYTNGTPVGSGGDIEADVAVLKSLSTDLSAAASAATTASSALDSDATIAGAQQQAIGTVAQNGGSTSAASTIAGQVVFTAQTACSLITPTTIDDLTQVPQITQDDLVSLLLTNQHCTQLSGSSDPAAAGIEAVASGLYRTEAGGDSVTLKLLSEYAAWGQVATNSASSAALGTAIKTLDADVAAGGPLDKMITALSSTGTDGSKLADADQLISLLAATGGSNPTCSSLTTAKTVPSVADFSDACLGIAGKPAAGSIAAISAALGNDTGTLGDTGTGLTTAGTDAANAVTGSDGMLGQLTTSLSKALQTTANGQITQDLNSLVSQQKTLMQQESGTSAQLDKETSAAVAALDTSVGGADKSQMSASAALVSLVNQVKSDLGSGSAGSHLGILGAIQSNSAETGIGAGQIDQATTQAGAFKGVRMTDVAANLLTQQELQAALQLAQSMGPFGPALPAGSTHTTVYVFHLAAIG